jgi:Tol biopolymer transport system component
MSISRRFLILLLFTLILLTACRGNRQQTGQPGGTLTLERDEVAHGTNASNLTVLEPDVPVAFDAGDFIRVRNGGRALLEFPDQVSLRLFDDTELEVLAVEFGEDVPLEFQIALTDGDVTGELVDEGGEVVFTTPTGAEITVLGTEFFISYNTSSQEMAAGNFDGTLYVRTPSMARRSSIGDGNYVTWTPGSSLSSEKSIPTTYQEFQERTDEMGGIPEVLAEGQTCTYDAHFVNETLDPASGRYRAGEAFRATWEIENNGDCPWPLPGFMVRSTSDEGGYDGIEVPVLTAVATGDTVEVSDLLTAHITPGSYRIDWQMVNPDGEPFGDMWTTRFTVVAPTPTPTSVYTPTPTATPTITPTLPPPDGVLAFSFGIEQPGLGVAAADGSTTRYLELSGQGPDLGPAGRLLAYYTLEYVDDLTPRGRINLYDFSSGEVSNLSDIAGGYDDLTPALSPDGQTIAYASHSPDNDGFGVYEIRTMDISGEPLGTLTDLGLRAGEPDWMPDGKTIIFTAGKGLTRNLFRVSVGGQAQPVTDFESGQVRYPQASPDGRQIAFSFRANVRAPEDMYVLNLTGDGPGIERLTADGDYFAPVWSPDGRYLAFSGPDGLYIMPPDANQKPQLVVQQANPRTSSWGPLYVTGFNYTPPALIQPPLFFPTPAPLLPGY